MMREEDDLDWLSIFDDIVICIISDYQIQPQEDHEGPWYPASFKEQCPPEKKFDMTKKFLQMIKRGYDKIEIGRRLYQLPYVKEYNTPTSH